MLVLYFDDLSMSPSIVYILLRYLLVRMKRYVIVDDGSLYKRVYIAGPPKKLNLFVKLNKMDGDKEIKFYLCLLTIECYRVVLIN